MTEYLGGAGKQWTFESLVKGFENALRAKGIVPGYDCVGFMKTFDEAVAELRAEIAARVRMPSSDEDYRSNFMGISTLP